MFVRPLLLLGLALLVPVLLAFLFKRRDRLATVPSTLLFRRVALSRMKNKRLRNVMRRLALIACVMAVGGLALAAAEPRLRGSTRTTAIVVDVSASMNGEPASDALDAVRAMLRQRDGHEYLALIAAGSSPRHLAGPTLDSAVLEDALDGLEQERGEADLAAALRLADGLVRGRRRGAIWLITDGGAASVEDRPTLGSPLSVLRVGQERENVGITVLAARAPSDAQTDAEREVLVTMAASAGEPRRVRLVLSVDGTELDRREVSVAGGGEAEESFRLRVRARELSAHIEPLDGRDDALALDDDARLDLGRSAPRTVHLISPEDAPGRFFVEQALLASGSGELVHHTPDAAPTSFGPGHLAVVLGAAPEHAIEAPTLFLAATQGELPVQVSGALHADAGQTELRSIDEDHALTRGVDLDEASIERAVAIELPEGAEAVVELDGGTVVATGGAGARRWAYVGVDPEGSDLVLRVAFPVLVANAMHALAGASDVRSAQTTPRREVALLSSRILAGAEPLDAPWPIPTGLPVALALFAALLLFGEGLAYQKGWSK